MAGHIPDSLSVDWCTPDWIIEAVYKLFWGPPDLDPCSNPYSRVAARREFTLEKGNDGLADLWAPARRVYVNPPFGKGWWKSVPGTNRREYIWPADRKLLKGKVKAGEVSEAEAKAYLEQFTGVSIRDWIARCHEHGRGDNTVVALIPAYTDTLAWNRYIWRGAARVGFIKGRVKFRLARADGSETIGPAPMACALVLWSEYLPDHHLFEDVFRDRCNIVIPRS